MDWLPWAVIGVLGYMCLTLGTGMLKRVKDALVIARELADMKGVWVYAMHLTMRPWHYSTAQRNMWEEVVVGTRQDVRTKLTAERQIMAVTGMHFEANALAAALTRVAAAAPSYPAPVSLEEALETIADMIDTEMTAALPGQVPLSSSYANAIRSLLRLGGGPAMGDDETQAEYEPDATAPRGTRNRRRKVQ